VGSTTPSLIRTMAKGGSNGQAVTLAPGQSDPRALASDGTDLYWFDGADAHVVKSTPLDGSGGITTWAAGGDPSEDARVIGVDQTNIYYNQYGLYGIVKATNTSFPIDPQNFIESIAVDDSGVYYAGVVGGTAGTYALFAYRPQGGAAQLMTLPNGV